MAVSDTGQMAGSVSGGCVEGAVAQEALAVLKSGRAKLLHFGVANETAWEVGLACGGQIDILVEPLAGLQRRAGPGPSAFEALVAAVEREEPAIRTAVTRGPDPLVGQTMVIRVDGKAIGSLGPILDEGVRAEARRALEAGAGRIAHYPLEAGEVEVFFDLIKTPPTLVIVGGVHIATDLARLARILGYRVLIVDPRRAFATAERFPQVDRLVTQWPDEGLREIGLTHATAVAVLSHDPKLDDPALLVALRSPAFYVGALGSPRTQALRRERLLKAGLTPDELARLHAPIGLYLGGRAPAEIALSILAEIVSAHSGATPATTDGE
jgi:xanthine dehydrogenase accessory factor